MRSRRQAAYSYGTNRRPGRRAYVIGKLHCAGAPGTYLWSDSLAELSQRDASTDAPEAGPTGLSPPLALLRSRETVASTMPPFNDLVPGSAASTASRAWSFSATREKERFSAPTSRPR